MKQRVMQRFRRAINRLAAAAVLVARLSLWRGGESSSSAGFVGQRARALVLRLGGRRTGVGRGKIIETDQANAARRDAKRAM